MSTPRRTWSSCCWAIRCVQGPRPPWGLLCYAVPLPSPWLCRDGALPAPSAGLCCFLGSGKARGDPRGLGGSGRAVCPVASGWQHEAEASGTGCSSYGTLRYGTLLAMGCPPKPGCTPGPQVTPSPRGPTRSQILSRGPRCFWVPSAQLDTGFSPGTGCPLDPG